MRNDLHFASGNNETSTPQHVMDLLVAQYTGGRAFDVDAAALASNAKAPAYYGPDHADPARRDCLTVPWVPGLLHYLNPPYGRTEMPCRRLKNGDLRCDKKRCEDRGWHIDVRIPGCEEFVHKAAVERERGVETFALLASRTDTKWFHDYVWDDAAGVWRPGVRGWFLSERITFVRAGGVEDNGAPFPSLLVHFTPAAI